MRAVIVRQFGDASTLAYEEVPDPQPGYGEVRIAVHAIGTNPVDVGNRADGAWSGIELPWTPGYEVSGVVDRVGVGVTKLSPGCRVVAMTDFPRGGGGYAEFTLVSESLVVRLPAHVPFVTAAATPLAGGTAWAILERLNLRSGARLLVLGASGGVGSYLVQLAALRGVETLAVSSSEHHRRLRTLGVTSCVDYNDSVAVEEFLTGPVRVDALASLAFGITVDPWLVAVRDYGQVAVIEPPVLDLSKLIDANLTLEGILVSTDPRRTQALVELLDDGRLLAPVSRVLPLSQAGDAHRILEGGHAGGKVVLQTEAGIIGDSETARR